MHTFERCHDKVVMTNLNAIGSERVLENYVILLRYYNPVNYVD